MPYKPAIKTSSDTNWCYNALVFATYAEAHASARDLFQRWTAVREYDATPTDDSVNYHRWDERDVSGYGPTPEQCMERAKHVLQAFATLGNIIAARASAAADDAALSEPAFLVPWTREVVVADLPRHVQDSVVCLGYTLRTVTLEVSHDRISVSSCANDGQRVTVCTAVQLPRQETWPVGELMWKHVTESGAWGGPNPFTKCSLDESPIRMIPSGGCITIARTARNRKSPWCTIHARAVDALAWLAQDAPELLVARDVIEAKLPLAQARAAALAREGLVTSLPVETLLPIQREVLRVYKGIKSAYRKSELARVASDSNTSIAVESLVASGYLKRARNGATSITPLGTNALK